MWLLRLCLRLKLFLHVARVWLQARVGSHVADQLTVWTETFTAPVTKTWLLPCVTPQVTCQILTLSKTFPTRFTNVWFKARVCSHVKF